MPYRRGRKSAAQTPAPRSERIKGSKKNPKGSAASQSSASKIVLSEKTIKALSQKVRDYNKKHKSSVSLNTLKAVFRRGAGAYSSSHRPTITGGAPNSRNAWAMARVNKFLMKKAGKKVKAAYVQDDDLLAKGGSVFDDKQLLKRYKEGKSIGFSAEAHLKAVGLLPRADGTKRKSDKYKGTYTKKIAKTYGEGGKVLYHGSPYKFEKFDLEKVGEGEGAQRFGYGVYATNLKDVANHYSLMPNKDTLLINGKKLNNYFSDDEIQLILSIWAESFTYSSKSKEEHLFEILTEIEKSSYEIDENSGLEIEEIEEINKDAKKYKKIFDILRASDLEIDGNIYQIKVDNLNLITHGEKISSDQAKCIFDKLSSDQKKVFGLKESDTYQTLTIFDGDGIYKAISKSFDYDTELENDKAATSFLFNCGINGIEYPSGNDFQSGGSNYVLFDPSLIKVQGKQKSFAEGGFNDEIIVCSNCLWSWKASESTPQEKYICHKCGHDNTPTMDKITMDVPLFIRLLEFAREDAKDDMELHTITENALNLGNKILTMEDYREIVFSKTTSSKITKSTSNVVEFPIIEEEFAEGGVVVGKRHSEEDEFGTGEKFLVESTGQVVELEGGEGVLCKESMQSKKIYNFDGKKMTGREIASYLNHKYGGVEFANGGQVDEKSVCGCRSMYYHGGELPSATLDSLKGGEAVVTVKTMESKDKFAFQGKQMTPRKILSHINQESGGKKFEEGGIIDLTQHHLKNMTEMVKMVNFTEKIFYF